MPETKFTTSFIPKKPIQSVGKGGRIKKTGSNLFIIIALFVFGVALIATAGVFLYELKLKNDIENQKTELDQVARELDSAFLDEAARLNDRINGVKELLDNHLSPSQIFAILEEKTVQSIQFKDLNFFFDNDGDLILDGRGIAASFESIIQQSDEYGDKGYLRDVLFSNLQNEEGGTVSFDFNSTINPELILYTNALPEVTNTFQQDGSENEEVDSESLIENMIENNTPGELPAETGTSTDSTATTDDTLIENTQ